MAEKESSETRTTLVAPTRPTITVPQRSPPLDAAGLLGGGLSLSPGPLTSFVSSLFADNPPELTTSEHRLSFSQLLGGPMASPTTRPTTFMGGLNPIDGLSRETNLGSPSEISSGFELSPLFTIPPGLSPSGLLSSPGFFSPASPFGMSHQQALAQVTVQAASFTKYDMQHQPLEYPTSQRPLLTSGFQGSAIESFELSRADKRNHHSYVANIDKPTDDGYNWRKYGQKPIKGCEFPRSYYKCTHANCPVKKKVERSSDGQITQIIYKGQHNHDKPQNRRGRDSNELSRFGSGGTMVAGGIMDMHQMGGLQLTESSDSEEGGNGRSREDDDEDDDENDRATKIRKIDGESGIVMSHRTVTEPKIIVQTRSEVDLLDDGYKWRKYGQKVVKGNPHPRSYYKCTTAGCTVRKHVERASTDPKAVITTYEGKHNHDVPAARTSSASQLKPHNHSLLKDMNFGSSGQRPVLIQLKEEEITV